MLIVFYTLFEHSIIPDHLYVSRVKFSFLYPLSIMTKRGRSFGEYVVFFFFFRFYMLGGEIHIFVRGRYVSSYWGSAYFLLLVHRSCDNVYIHCNYIWYIYIYIWCMFFFTYLYMCCFFSIFIHMVLIYCMQSYISVSH